MGFSRQEYWSGLPCPPPGAIPDPGIEITSLTSPALTDRFFTTGTTWEAQLSHPFFSLSITAGLLTGCPAINTEFSFTTTESVDRLYYVQANRGPSLVQ